MSLRRKLMMRMGAAMVNQLNAGEDRLDVLARFARGIAFPERDAFHGAPLPGHFATDTTIVIAMTAMQWGISGFPLVTLGHKLAASFMAMSIPDEVMNEIVLPWPTFAIAVPVGLLGSEAPAHMLPRDGSAEPSVQHMVVMKHDNGNVGIFGQYEQFGTGMAVTATDWASLIKRVESSVDATPDGKPLHESLKRLVRLAIRLATGVCIELDQPKHRIVIGEGRPKEKREKRGEPKAWTFDLKRDVRIDCREWVKSFILGREGTSPSMQTLVRGHHKRQPCGPNRQDRKWIHVEPYWRGPEDAPIAVRAHNVSGRLDSATK